MQAFYSNQEMKDKYPSRDHRVLLERLAGRICAGLPPELAEEFPEKALSSIRVKADLSGVWPKFAVWLLTDKDHGVLRFARTCDKQTIQRVSDLYEHGGTPDEFKNASYAAGEADVGAGASSYAARATYAAACSGFRGYGFYSIHGVAAADAADAAASANAPQNAYIAQSTKLLELLAAA